MKIKKLIVVVGPTAIGKTALGIKLAQHFNSEIISSDSRQFFKEMHIGTAVPDNTELKAAKHHFIQHISIKNKYSVGDFEKEALQQIEILHQKNNYVIMVGGSGLYADAVCYGLDEFPEVLPEIKAKLNNVYKEEGIAAVAKILKDKDPNYYEKVDIQNPQRLLRAVEVCLSSGKPFSSFLKKYKVQRPFKVIKIGLTADRQVIYDRINFRVDLMLKNGLLEEVKKLLPYKDLNALNTVGYKELFEYFNGEWDLDFATSEIKKNTRRFAKRQLTWYRKDETINWFDYQYNFAEIIKVIEGEK